MVTTANDLAARIAPRLRAAVDARRDQAIAAAGNLMRRQAVKVAWPTILDEIPILTDAAVEMILAEFGKMNVTDLMTFLAQNAQAREAKGTSCGIP